MFTMPGSSPSEIMISPAMATRKEHWGFFTIAVNFTKNQDLTGCTQRAQRVSSWGSFLCAIFLGQVYKPLLMVKISGDIF
jgi:hypothetical protein